MDPKATQLQQISGDSPPADVEEGEHVATVATGQPVDMQSDPEPATPPEAPVRTATPQEAVVAPAEVPRRTLKLVLTLEPSVGPGYHALLALGAEGCDPLFRSLDAESLPTVLDEVPSLMAEAEAHWQSQPRYPNATPPAKPTTAPKRAGSAAKPPPPPSETGRPEAHRQEGSAQPAGPAGPRPADDTRQPGEARPHEPGSDAAPTKRSSAGQLPLFG